MITTLRHNTPDPADIPPEGWLGATFSAVSGLVTGEVVRSIFDGGTVSDEAQLKIDGHDTAVRVADVQTDDPLVLRDLAAVAGCLADELAGDPAARSFELFRTNDGHGSRIIVEHDGETVAITVRSSQDPRDAQRVVLSQVDAVALREALALI
ncbi:MAG: hypothetical protein WBA50_10780 [Mycobacterium sp.]